MKCILRRVDRADGLGERLLLELFLDCQAEFGELFDVRPRVKLQLFKLGKNDERFLQLSGIWRLSWLRSFSLNGGTLLDDSLLFLG